MPVNINGNIISSTSLGTDSTFANSIATSGLICHLDANNINSYPASGTTWYDLSTYGNNVTIYGGAAYTTVGGCPSFNLTADGHYMQGTSMTGFPTTALTMEIWAYPAASELTSGDRGALILCNGGSAAYMSITKDTLKQSNYWYAHTPEGYHEQTSAVSRGAWHHFCCVWDNTNVHQWTDGNYGKVFSVSGTSTSNSTWTMGREGSSRQFSGAIAVVRMYNRALSNAEVINNFYSQKTRFGL